MIIISETRFIFGGHSYSTHHQIPPIVIDSLSSTPPIMIDGIRPSPQPPSRPRTRRQSGFPFPDLDFFFLSIFGLSFPPTHCSFLLLYLPPTVPPAYCTSRLLYLSLTVTPAYCYSRLLLLPPTVTPAYCCSCSPAISLLHTRMGHLMTCWFIY